MAKGKENHNSAEIVVFRTENEGKMKKKETRNNYNNKVQTANKLNCNKRVAVGRTRHWYEGWKTDWYADCWQDRQRAGQLDWMTRRATDKIAALLRNATRRGVGINRCICMYAFRWESLKLGAQLYMVKWSNGQSFGRCIMHEVSRVVACLVGYMSFMVRRWEWLNV